MSQKTNSMIKLALVFFICLLSFSIGTYVGKKYSDNQYKLAQLEPNKKGAHDTAGTEFAANTDSAGHEEGQGETTHAATATSEKHEGGSQKLTDSEVAKIAEEFATEHNDSATTMADSAHEKTIHSTDEDEKPIKSIAADKPTHTTAATTHTTAAAVKPMPAKKTVAATTTASHDREPSSIPQTKEGTSVGAHYTVQIGSFPSEADAQKMTKEMLAKGIKTSYVSAQVKGQTYYRVNVGLFGTAKEADEYKKDFLEKTKLTSAFVQKVQ